MCENSQNEFDKLNHAAGIHKKRLSSSGLNVLEAKACEKLLLELVCHIDSLPFHHRVSKQVPNYYKIVTKPMDFGAMKMKLQGQTNQSYKSVEEFIHDIHLIFSNCALFNPPDADVAKLGKSLENFYNKIKGRYFPNLQMDSNEPMLKKRREDYLP